VKVKDILTTKGSDYFSIAPEITVKEAMESIADKKIGALLVISNEKLVGIITERDIFRRQIIKPDFGDQVTLENDHYLDISKDKKPRYRCIPDLEIPREFRVRRIGTCRSCSHLEYIFPLSQIGDNGHVG